MKGSVKRITNIALEKRQAIASTISSPSCTSGDSAVSSETVRSLKAEQNEVTKDGVYEEMPMGMIIVTQGRPLVLSLQAESQVSAPHRGVIQAQRSRHNRQQGLEGRWLA